MANTRSAKKMMRVAARRRQRNKPVRTTLKTYIKAAKALIEEKDPQSAQAVVVAIRALDKAAQKGIIHPNNAARRKSRLMRKLNAMSAG